MSPLPALGAIVFYIPSRSFVTDRGTGKSVNNEKAPVSGGFLDQSGNRLLEVEVQADRCTADTGIDTEVAALASKASVTIVRAIHRGGHHLGAIP